MARNPVWRRSPWMLSLLLAWMAIPRPGEVAQAACNAPALCADPNAALCVVSTRSDVDPGCTLDFAGRDVLVQRTLSSAVSGGGFSILAGSLTLQGAKLKATGGGSITVQVSGLFRTEGGRTGTGVNVNGTDGGGTFLLTAGSVEHTAGVIQADGSGDYGDGIITINAPGPVEISDPVTATGGAGDSSGGTITVTGSDVTIGARIDAGGGGSGGGSITVTSAGNLLLAATGDLRANGSLGGESAGDGGEVVLQAGGDLTAQGTTSSRGSSPDGAAGSVSMTAGGDLVLLAPVDVVGPGSDSDGGQIDLAAGGDIQVAANLDAHGGNAWFGGNVTLTATGGITVSSGVDIVASAGYQAGNITFSSSGPLVLDGRLLARADKDVVTTGGSVQLEHCSLAINGVIDVGASTTGTAGTTTLSGYSILVAPTATVLATPCTTLPTPSCNRMILRSGSPDIQAGAVLDPPPDLLVDPDLLSCCGNGILEPGSPEECDDGNRLNCDRCSSRCVSGPPEPEPVCPEDNPCATLLGCDPLTGCLLDPVPDGQPCPDDGDLCTDDLCSAGQCTHPPHCEDDLFCTLDSCDPLTGACTNTPDDGICQEAAGFPPCHDSICNGQTAGGCSISMRPNGAACVDRQDHCMLLGACRWGKCFALPGAQLNCDDGNPCTTDSCDSMLGCMNLEDPNCTSCDNLPAGSPCADGDPCTVNDTCDGAGRCLPGPPRDCDDGDPCTSDSCFSFWQCFHSDDLCSDVDCSLAPDGTPCSDGEVCTVGTCQGGVCVSAPNDCGDDGNPCDGEEFCVQGPSGCRRSFPPPVCLCGGDAECDDGNPCTDDTCVPELGCQHTPGSGSPPCDDGDACTLYDLCQDGECVSFGSASCDDQNPCTDDACDSAMGCTHTPNSGPCDDGNACTIGDVCSGGTCVGLPTCDDGNPCTDDLCDPNGGCTHVPNSSPCDDGNPCTASDVCSGGVCAGVPACDDGQFCNGVESCDPVSGCVAGTPPDADDGIECTVDRCDEASDTIVHDPDPAACDDGEVCTLDRCDPGLGCVHTPGSGSCDDGNPCTEGELCSGGVCGSGVPVSCDDEDVCTLDRCDPASGCRSEPIPGCCDLDLDGERCDEDECETLVFSEPPTSPPDQNPSRLTLRLTKLDRPDGEQGIAAGGFFNPATTTPAVDPAAHGVRVRIEDRDGEIYDVSIPGLDSGLAPCGSRDGWTVRSPGVFGRTSWRYRNRSGQLPPGCADGSARGIRRIEIRDRRASAKGAFQLKVKGKRATLTRAPGLPLERLQLTLVLGAQAADGSSGPQARSGQCAEFAIEGSPVPSQSPRPFCKVSSTGGAPRTIRCKGP